MHAIQYKCTYIEHTHTCYTYNTYLSTSIQHIHTYTHAMQCKNKEHTIHIQYIEHTIYACNTYAHT